MNRVQAQTKDKTQIGLLQAGILLLAAATAIIHIVLAVPDTLWMFYLNGLAYLVLAAALYFPGLRRFQTLIRLALIGLAAVTILGWVFVGERSLIGYVDKAIEIALIVLLVLDWRRS